MKIALFFFLAGCQGAEAEESALNQFFTVYFINIFCITSRENLQYG